jgi:hypothetical protein
MYVNPDPASRVSATAHRAARRRLVTVATAMALSMLALVGVRTTTAAATDPDQPVVGPSFLPDPVVPSELAQLCAPRAANAVAPLPLQPSNTSTPALLRSFDGLKRSASPVEANGASDTNGAAGPDRYVQVINKAVGIFTKDGQPLCDPISTSAIWDGMGAPCAGGSYSDGVVVYDRLSNRWVLSRFADENQSGDVDEDAAPTDDQKWYQCMAVSETGDPTGAYERYAFQVNVLPGGSDKLYFNDYPKLGVWPDAYYYTADADKIYRPDGKGLYAVAFERSAMINGTAAQEVVFFLPRQPGDNGYGEMSQLQPANWDGSIAPPANSPGYLAQALDDGLGFPAPDRVALWSFHVDWAQETASLTPQYLTPDAFDSVPCGQSGGTIEQVCIPQPGTTQRLDSLAYGYLGFRLVYRNLGDRESLALAQTIAAPDSTAATPHTAIRWYEFQKRGAASWTIRQQGTLAPDSSDRWLPSIGVDAAGNIALGFSVSNDSSLYPSIHYAARTATDPPGTMRPERSLQDGGGAQTAGGSTGKGADAFGDYADMTIDPTDDCTFWFTSVYYASNADGAQHDFSTRIGAFRFGPNGGRSAGGGHSCSAAPAPSRGGRRR